MTIRSRADLIAAEREGQRLRYLFFWGHTAKGEGPGPWVLSQWWPSPFAIGEQTYATAEHYMMAEKARLFGDDAARAAIIAARHPGEAKALGRGVRGFVEQAWREARTAIVVAGNEAKFAQDDALRAFLAGTGERILVEASPLDRIWGIGLDAKDPRSRKPAEWRGDNLLGFALMEIRSRLRFG